LKKVYIAYEILDYGLGEVSDAVVFEDEDMAMQYATEKGLCLIEKEITYEY